MNEKTANIGPEGDQAIRRKLRSVLKKLGGVERSRSWGAGGSQELEEVTFGIGNECITVRAETYRGIEIVGSPELVGKLVKMVEAKRAWAIADATFALFRWTSGACGLIACLHGPFNVAIIALGARPGYVWFQVAGYVAVAMVIGMFTSLCAAAMCAAQHKGPWHVGFHLLAFLACVAWGWLLSLMAIL